MKAAWLALGAVTLWATNAVVARQVLGDLAVEQVQVLQFAGATAVFLVARLFSRGVEGSLGLGTALGLLGVTGTMVFQYLAFSAGPIAETNIVAYAWPLLAALLFIAGGKLDRPWRFLAITALGFLGAALVIMRDEGGIVPHAAGRGHLWAMASAFCMASYSAAIGRVKCNQDSVHLAGSVAGLGLAALWCAGSGVGWPNPTASNFWLGLYLGAGPIGVGYLLWARAMRNDPAGRMAALGYLTPVASTALLVISGAAIGPQALLGGVIVIACCAATGMEAREHA